MSRLVDFVCVGPGMWKGQENVILLMLSDRMVQEFIKKQKNKKT